MLNSEDTAAAAGADDEHAVIAQLKLADDSFGTTADRARVTAIGEAIEMELEGSDLGEFDGDESGEGYSWLYCYGPDADRLADAVLPHLRDWPQRADSYVVKRYGGPGAREERIPL